MIVILSNMNIDLTVDEFIELNARTNLFCGIEKPVETPEPVKEPEQEEILENFDLVNSTELSKYLGVAPCTITKYRTSGMPYVEMASTGNGKSKYMYNKDVCKKWREENIDQSFNHHSSQPVEEAPNGNLLNTDEIAKYLGVSKSSMWYFRNQGMPAVESCTRFGKKLYLYDKDMCAAWYKNRCEEMEKKDEKPAVKKQLDISAYVLWKSRINQVCREAKEDTGKMLSLTYKYMTKNYGIVWDQEAKEFAEDFGYRPHSTSQLAYWLGISKPACKNLVMSCLDTIIKERKSA